MNISAKATDINPVCEAAVELAKAGWYVFPSPKKNGAAHIKWRTGSSRSSSVILSWWKRWPKALLCVDCQRSKVGVVDIDQKNGKDGAATIARFEDDLLVLPPTLEQRTPSGGLHKIYSDPDNKLRSTTGEPGKALGVGVDTRGRGGMIVVAPSQEEGSAAYTWLNDIPLDQLPPIPDWVVELAGKNVASAVAPDAECEPAYSDEEFAELIKLIPVEQFDGKHDAWLKMLLACTHSSTVADGKPAFMEWTTAGEYIGDYDIISARWDANIQNRNKGGDAYKVGTFNYYLKAAGFEDRVKYGTETNASEDFPPTDDDDFTGGDKPKPKNKKARADAIKKVKKLRQIRIERGSAPREVEKALQQINALVVRFNITAEDVEIGGDDGGEGVTSDYRRWFAIKRNWVWIGQLMRFIEIADPLPKWTKEGFNDYFKSVKVPDKLPATSIASYIFSNDAVKKFKGMTFAPGAGQNVSGKFNTWKPSDIKPAEGDTTLWDGHLKYLFTNPADIEHALNWMAWVLQNLGKAPKHALLIHGEIQGTGKSFLAHMMCHIVGTHNSWMLNKSTFDNDFTPWAEHSKICYVEEVRPGHGTSELVISKLHDLISEPNITINIKGISQYTITNVIAWMLFSNKPNALAIDNSDRRHLILSADSGRNSPLAVKPDAYYDALYGLLDNPKAIAAVAHQLMTRDLKGYRGNAPAPYTAAKGAMQEATADELTTWFNDNADEPPLSYSFVTIEEIAAALDDATKRAVAQSSRQQGAQNQRIASLLRSKLRGESLGKVRFGGRAVKQLRIWAINKKTDAPLERWKYPAHVIAKMYRNERGNFSKTEEAERAAAKAVKIAALNAEFADDDLGLGL